MFFLFFWYKSTWVKYWSLEQVLGVKTGVVMYCSCHHMQDLCHLTLCNQWRSSLIMQVFEISAVHLLICLVCDILKQQMMLVFVFLLSVHLFKLMRIRWDLFPVAPLQVCWRMISHYLLILFLCNENANNHLIRFLFSTLKTSIDLQLQVIFLLVLLLHRSCLSFHASVGQLSIQLKDQFKVSFKVCLLLIALEERNISSQYLILQHLYPNIMGCM